MFVACDGLLPVTVVVMVVSAELEEGGSIILPIVCFRTQKPL